jgi:transcriptional antiterminator Rof (Rho-off)
MAEYKSISCSFYDELINSIVLKQSVKIYLDDLILEGKLNDVFTRNKEEFILIHGQEIRLDYIKNIEFDGLPSKYIFEDFCNFDQSSETSNDKNALDPKK